MRLWNNREKLNNPGSVKSYLFRTVRNASIDHLRRKDREEKGKRSLIQLHPLHEKDILAGMIETETYIQIHRAIESLPPKCREVFKRFYIEGKSYQEIADELQISVHTVCNQKARALKLFREKLPPHATILFLAVCRIIHP